MNMLFAQQSGPSREIATFVHCFGDAGTSAQCSECPKYAVFPEKSMVGHITEHRIGCEANVGSASDLFGIVDKQSGGVVSTQCSEVCHDAVLPQESSDNLRSGHVIAGRTKRIWG